MWEGFITRGNWHGKRKAEAHFLIPSLKGLNYAYIHVDVRPYYSWAIPMPTITLNGHRYASHLSVLRNAFTVPCEWLVEGENHIAFHSSGNRPDPAVSIRATLVLLRRAKGATAMNPGTSVYFPKEIDFLNQLNDEELHVVLTGIPTLVTEVTYRSYLDRKNLAYVYTRIGTFFRWQGRYLKSLAYHQKALSSARKRKSKLMEAYILGQTGLTFLHMGDYAKARECCLRAIELLESLDRDRLKQTIESTSKDALYTRESPAYLHNVLYGYLSLVHFGRKDYDEALECAYKSMKRSYELVSWQLLNDSDDLVVESVGERVEALVFSERGEHEKAIGLLKRMLKLMTITDYIHRYPQEVANTQFILAHVYFLAGRHTEAFETLEAIEEPYRGIRWKIHFMKAEMYGLKGHSAKALTEYKQAIEIVESSRTELQRADFKITFMEDKQVLYQEAIDLLMDAGDGDQALDYVERAKARAFLDMLGDRDIRKKQPPLAGLTKQAEKLKGRIAFLDQRAEEEISALGYRSARSNGEIRGLKVTLSKTLKQISTVDPEYLSLTSVSTMDTAAIRQMLPPEGVSILEYFLTSRRLHIWILNRNRVQGRSVNVTPEEIERLVRQYRAAVTRPKEECPEAENIRAVKRTGEALYDILIAPIRHQISGEHVCIIPHGVLHYIPFQGLWNDGKYLAKDHAVTYLPSSTTLRYVLEKSEHGSKTVLALGDPHTAQESIPPLPSAREEVHSIGKTYPEAVIRTGEAAMESLVKREGMNYRVLHIASHGEFNQQDPMYSCLHLAPGEGQDGRLETHEIFNLNLNASLVVTSCCNTAIGRILKGDELIGMNRAFIYAGTPSILGTLWSINDESTSFFMKRFYALLRETTPAKALRQTQVDMMAHEEYGHPFYWAPFVLTGGWR